MPIEGFRGPYRLTTELVNERVLHTCGGAYALGIDSGGNKHVLGLWQGATENTTVVQALLEDLVARGVPPTMGSCSRTQSWAAVTPVNPGGDQ